MHVQEAAQQALQEQAARQAALLAGLEAEAAKVRKQREEEEATARRELEQLEREKRALEARKAEQVWQLIAINTSSGIRVYDHCSEACMCAVYQHGTSLQVEPHSIQPSRLRLNSCLSTCYRFHTRGAETCSTVCYAGCCCCSTRG